MIAYLPPSLRGLMVAAFAAAYMSTIATQLNWGASYIVNDFYRRFLKPHATDHHYVVVASARDCPADLRLRRRHVLYGLHLRRMENYSSSPEPAPGSVLLVPLVLVAHQRLERSVGG